MGGGATSVKSLKLQPEPMEQEQTGNKEEIMNPALGLMEQPGFLPTQLRSPQTRRPEDSRCVSRCCYETASDTSPQILLSV